MRTNYISSVSLLDSKYSTNSLSVYVTDSVRIPLEYTSPILVFVTKSTKIIEGNQPTFEAPMDRFSNGSHCQVLINQLAGAFAFTMYPHGSRHFSVTVSEDTLSSILSKGNMKSFLIFSAPSFLKTTKSPLSPSSSFVLTQSWS